MKVNEKVVYSPEKNKKPLFFGGVLSARFKITEAVGTSTTSTGGREATVWTTR